MAMKTFTSLFALLSCLSVYNAQAETVTIYVHPTNPAASPKIHWWNATVTSDWNTNLLSNYDTETFNSILYYKVSLIPTNSGVCVQFHDNDGETSNTSINNLTSGT